MTELVTGVLFGFFFFHTRSSPQSALKEIILPRSRKFFAIRQAWGCDIEITVWQAVWIMALAPLYCATSLARMAGRSSPTNSSWTFSDSCSVRSTALKCVKFKYEYFSISNRRNSGRLQPARVQYNDIIKRVIILSSSRYIDKFFDEILLFKQKKLNASVTQLCWVC